MHITRCIHPPGGATALIAVIGGSDVHALGYSYALLPVGLNVLVMLAVAVVFNYLFAWRRYPAVLHARQKRQKNEPDGIQIEDIEHALHTLDTPVDVTESELQLIYKLAEQHAARRHIDQKR
jgi:CBS-domain-containing membrane protein